MASTTSNPLLSTTFHGTQIHPRRYPSSLPLFFLTPRRSNTKQIQSLLLPSQNRKPNSENQPNFPSQATLATFLFTALSQTTPQALALDNPTTPPTFSPPMQAEATKPSSSSSPFSQSLLLTAPKTQTPASSDLPEGSQWRYSEFLNAVKKGKVERVRFSKDGTGLQLTAVDGRRASVTVPNDPDLIDILAMNGVDISVSEGDSGNGLFGFIGNLLFPFLAFAGLFFLFRRAQGGPGGPGGLGGPMDFGRSKSKFQEVPETGVTFADVAGADQAKLELQEVVDFLKNPDKYTALGAKIPKGCLLVGPPGTGKTLLARAVAGEAGVPFFSCAASEFVELFVGVGASRVRDLFEKAKSKAPCIVFIDEIDAVGRQRGAGLGGGNDEREQTINQLLTEMDGFSGNSGVIVLAATNRPDVLDSALLRPGRFDRQVTVDRPDVAGRVKILQVHSRGKALAKDVDFEKISRRTPGFTGADLQNLMNEAAILAARRDLKEISKDEISDALERIIAGPEKKNAVVSEEKKKLVAYHEAGHALVGALMPEYDPVAKISIIPRGQAGGLTFFAPSEERLESGLYSRSYLENQMAVALGGRVAEEVIFATKKTPPKKESENPPSKSEQEESSSTKATQVKSPPSTGAKAVKKIVKKATPKSAPKPEPKVEEIATTSDAPQATGDSTPVSSAKSTEKKIVRIKKSPSLVKAKAGDSTKKEAPAMQVEKEDEQKSAAAQTEEKEKEEVKEGQKVIEDAKEPETTNTVKIEEENPAENPIGEDEYGAEGEEYGGEEKFEEPGDEEYAQDDLSEPEEVEEEDGQMEEEQMQMSDLAKERKLKKAQEIFVGGLDRDAVEDDVKKVFEKIGEVLEVRLHRNLQTNKNKGFAFVKFANQEQASRALSELKSPVIRGKQCGVAPSEDNDTLFLGNICNTWTKEAIKRKLKEYGVEGVENITLVADAQHEGLSRGFAFIEFSCHADAMLAYKCLQKPDVIFGHPERTVKVAFAEPLREPDPEIMAQVKSVFVDGLLPHWDEDRVRDQFKGYGEIERVVLARNMATAKRKDFGFVDFTTHEDAIACIEGVNNTELGDGKTKVKVKARLSNPLPKTQAVKGGMRGGFRIRHPAVGFGRGFVHAKRPLDRVGFERGRAFHPRGRGRMGRFSQADGHDFGGRRPFRGRGHFGGRRGSFGRSTYDNEFVTRSATSSRFELDRPRPGALDIGHAETFQYGRHPLPEREYGRPFGGRHFDDSFEYDGAGSGLKRTFSMMDDESGYLESGSRLRPRYDFPDPVSHRTHYRDTIGTSGGLYPHDYYGSDYGGSAYSSLYEDEYSVGRRYYY